MEHKDLVRDVLQAAGEFNGRQLWKRFTNFDCFAVRISSRHESMLAIVMGDAGEEYGLTLLRGPGAAADLSALLAPGGPGDDALENADMLSFSMEAFENLPPEAQAYFQEAGQHPRHDDQVPSFLAKPPGRRPRLPDESELTLLLLVLRGVVEADKKKLLQPAGLGTRGGICVVTVSDDPIAPQASVTRERWQPQDAAQTVRLPSEEADLAGIPHLDAIWLVGTPIFPEWVKDNDRALQLLVVVDEASGDILHARTVFAAQPQEALKGVLSTFRGEGRNGQRGMPRKIVFSNRKLHDAMAQALKRAGVQCLYMPSIPRLQEIVAVFFEHLAGKPPAFADYVDTPSPPETEVPSPDDLAGWKEADGLLTRRFAKQMNESGFWSARSLKGYFGDEDAKALLVAHEARAIAQAYTTWVILDYRLRRTAKTRAESMLAKGLPGPEAMLLRARIESHPSLYRVASHDAEAGAIVLEDVLLGGEVTVHDQVFSESVNDGVLVVSRVFPVGRFNFFDPAGPPLGALMGEEAGEFLHELGLDFTREGLRRGAHLFGRLWGWLDRWEKNCRPRHLCNTDGDDLLWHTASFSVEAPQKVRGALAGRMDIQYDQTEDEYRWIRDAKGGSKILGDTLHLGRIELVGDELILTVNSTKRFATARKWLQELPGVVFRNVTTRRMDVPAKDRPLDERICKPQPVEMTPELTASMQEMMNKQYMEWLDTPLPMLGDKTPREACLTPDGRRQVTMLIRTTPDPMGPVPVRVPRQAMLRELGFADGPSTQTVVPPDQPLGGPQVHPGHFRTHSTPLGLI